MAQSGAGPLAVPIETSAHRSDRTRARKADRPWYAYAATLLPEAGAAGRFVDLGCGQGEFLGQARERGLSGLGLDFWAPNARAAVRTGSPALAADLNRPLPFRDASLDGLCLVEVIEHIVRAEQLVEEMARVLRPGGWLVLTTPNVVHWTYRWRALTGHAPKQEGYHYRFFTRERLARMLAARGFALEARASFGKQALLTRLARIAGGGRERKVRYRVPAPLEPLLAQHFVWRLRRLPSQGAR
jgi:SAM-dependent methyltransferase